MCLRDKKAVPIFPSGPCDNAKGAPLSVSNRPDEQLKVALLHPHCGPLSLVFGIFRPLFEAS